MPKSSENLRKFSEELWNLREFPKTSEMLQTCFIFFEKLKRYMKILANFWQSLEIFGKLWKRSKMVLTFSENLRECSETFRKLWKRFKSVFQMILWFFKKLWKSSKISENFRNGSKVFFRCFYCFSKFSENLWKSSEVYENHQKISGRDVSVLIFEQSSWKGPWQ